MYVRHLVRAVGINRIRAPDYKAYIITRRGNNNYRIRVRNSRAQIALGSERAPKQSAEDRRQVSWGLAPVGGQTIRCSLRLGGGRAPDYRRVEQGA